MSLKSAILEVVDKKIEVEIVPEWGNVKVGLRQLSSKELDIFQTSFLDKRGEPKKAPETLINMRPKLLVLVLVDPDTGELLFKNTPEDIEALGGKSRTVLDRLFVKAKQINGMNLEEAEKNSLATDGEEE